MSVWVLPTSPTYRLMYSMAALMPNRLANLVRCMIVFVVLVDFYLLVLCKHQQYQALNATSIPTLSSNWCSNDELTMNLAFVG